MAIWWLKVAEEIAALHQSGVERPDTYVPDLFSHDGPAIETSYRVVAVEAPPGPPAVLAEPARQAESRFHSEGHLFNTGRGESSFLAEGRRRKSNIRSWS